MKYIKCISLYNREPIYINIDKIETISKNNQDETFINTNNSSYRVLESVDAVLNMIKDIVD